MFLLFGPSFFFFGGGDRIMHLIWSNAFWEKNSSFIQLPQRISTSFDAHQTTKSQVNELTTWGTRLNRLNQIQKMQLNKHQIQVPNVGIFWIYPPPTNSYCQDCYIVSFGRFITFHWVSSLQLELQQVGKCHCYRVGDRAKAFYSK